MIDPVELALVLQQIVYLVLLVFFISMQLVCKCVLKALMEILLLDNVKNVILIVKIVLDQLKMNVNLVEINISC